MSDAQTEPDRGQILIVDDDEGQRMLLETFLRRQGYATHTAAGARAALELLDRHPFGLVISDVRMPDMTGLDLLASIREFNRDLPVLLVTAFADVRDAVRAMRDGAVNYLEKPIDLNELLDSVRHTLAGGPAPRAPGAVPPGLSLPPGLIAQSPAMRAILDEIGFVAPTDARVLISGESGVGKEVIADALHQSGPRATQPIIKLNCAAIPEPLLESELFGHERGAFTGAVQQRIGCFEQAGLGTLLLDEIGEIPLALQAKLLRVLQDGSFRRIGGARDMKAQARILATTNRDLEKEVEAGRFREDLFFRLNVFEIVVPPLRRRQADVMPLARLFAAQFSGGQPRFSSNATSRLEAYAWPGNVRELRNAIERAVLMARGDMILPEHLPARVQAGQEQAPHVEEGGTSHRMQEMERLLILRTLRENNFNRSETARVLGISRRALLYKLQRLREQGFDTALPGE